MELPPPAALPAGGRPEWVVDVALPGPNRDAMFLEAIHERGAVDALVSPLGDAAAALDVIVLVLVLLELLPYGDD